MASGKDPFPFPKPSLRSLPSLVRSFEMPDLSELPQLPEPVAQEQEHQDHEDEERDEDAEVDKVREEDDAEQDGEEDDEVQRSASEHPCPIHSTEEECKRRRLSKDPKQRDEITARLLNPIITFKNTSEALRNSTEGRSNILPQFFYRTYYKTSTTLSSRVSKDTHVKHRERKKLKISKGNAFQAVGKVNINLDLTMPRIDRQLIWNKKTDPSAYISVFNNLRDAKRRADFHYADSQRIGHRVSIAKISTKGLVAATLSADCVTKWSVYTKVKIGESVKYTLTTNPIDIPIWVSSYAMPKDGSSITGRQLKASGAELWMSITELRMSNMKNLPRDHGRRNTLFVKGHDYEWLALGKIPEARILQVMPFDGKTLHNGQGSNIVYSRESPEPWIYDWDLESWRLDPDLFELGKFRAKGGSAGEFLSRKRKASDAQDKEQRGRKAPRRMNFKVVRPYYQPC